MPIYGVMWPELTHSLTHALSHSPPDILRTVKAMVSKKPHCGRLLASKAYISFYHSFFSIRVFKPIASVLQLLSFLSMYLTYI